MPQVAVLAITSRAADTDRLHRVFASSNWQLHTAGSIADAVQHVAEFQTPIVLCAESVDGEPWHVVLQWLRARNPEVQVVIIARSMDDAGSGEALLNGAFDVLPTPLEAPEVLRVVASAWRHWRTSAARRRRAAARMAAHAQSQTAGFFDDTSI